MACWREGRNSPEGRGGVEAPHIEALLKDHAGAERDQRIGSQARETLAPLPLEADGGAEASGDEEVQSGVRKLHGHDGNSKAIGSKTERGQPRTFRPATLRATGRWKDGRRFGATAVVRQ